MLSRTCGRSLLDAVRNNSVEAVQDILGSGCENINECDNQQNTPLILAASKGSVALLRLLLGAGADANRQNSSGHTALTRACAAGKVEVVQLLLAAPNAQTHLHLQDNHGNTALLWCARTGNAALCRLLIDAGANVNQVDSGGRTPIFHACVASALTVAEQLITAGADLGLRDSMGKCAIDYAQNPDMRALLLNSGSLPEGSRRTSFNVTASTTPTGLPLLGGSSVSLTGPTAAPLGAVVAPAVTSPPMGPLVTNMNKGRSGSSRPSPAYHALTGAVQAGNEVAVAAMLAVPGADALLAQRDMLHNSVLHVAASRGLLPIMVKLLELARQLHADIDEPNIDGHTPLYLACRAGHRGVVQVLLGAGASPNIPSREASTALHACAAGGHADIVRMLLDRGANLNAADSHALTPLLRAAELGHANVCSILLRQGANINHRRRDGSTALLAAVRGGRVGVVQLLLAAGANPNIADNDGETPLIEASTAGALQIVQTLVAHSVDVQACNHIGETALMRASVHRDPTIVEELITVGARLDAADRELGFTALMYAASQGSSAVVSRLLSAGAAVGHANNMGISALLLASRSGYLEVVDLLLQAGASIDQADLKGYTPLMVACVGGYTGVVSHLLRAGANVNLRNYEGYTALSAAMEFGQKAVAELLVRHGADASALTGGGHSGYGSSSGNGCLRAAASSTHGNMAPGTAMVGTSSSLGADGVPCASIGNSGGGVSPGAMRYGHVAGMDMLPSVASRAATASSLQMHLDGLPNSVSATHLAREAGAGGTASPATSSSGPVLTHTAKFLHELDAYDLLQRRNSRNATGSGSVVAVPAGQGLGGGGGAREAGGVPALLPTSSPLSPVAGGNGPANAGAPDVPPSTSQRLLSPQKQGGVTTTQQLQLSSQQATPPPALAPLQQVPPGQGCSLTVEELTSHLSMSSDTSKDASSREDKQQAGIMTASPAGEVSPEGLKGSSGHYNSTISSPRGAIPPKPLFTKMTSGQPDDPIILDPDGPDLFEPGRVYRSPWAKVVSFRDPCAEDVVWYEPSEPEDLAGAPRKVGTPSEGTGCGCVIS